MFEELFLRKTLSIGKHNQTPPDISVICFQNSEIWYFSYDPPKGTAEEIMQFRGANLKKIQRRDEMGTLELRGDDRL